jgi:hypothetical protein
MTTPTQTMKTIDNSREMQPVLDILNQIFEIEKKVQKLKEENSINRNVRRLKAQFENGFRIIVGQDVAEVSLTYHDPTGEPYDETRTDCDASIAGESADGLRIVEAIKPIIRLQQGGISIIVQRAVVIVRSDTPAPGEA